MKGFLVCAVIALVLLSLGMWGNTLVLRLLISGVGFCFAILTVLISAGYIDVGFHSTKNEDDDYDDDTPEDDIYKL